MKSQEDDGDEEDKGEDDGFVREESVGSDEAGRRQEEVDDLAEEEDDPLDTEAQFVYGFAAVLQGLEDRRITQSVTNTMATLSRTTYIC